MQQCSKYKLLIENHKYNSGLTKCSKRYEAVREMTVTHLDDWFSFINILYILISNKFFNSSHFSRMIFLSTFAIKQLVSIFLMIADIYSYIFLTLTLRFYFIHSSALFARKSGTTQVISG